MQHQPQFRDVILQGNGQDLDMTLFEAELTGVISTLLECHPEIGALVLECTDLSCFSQRLQARFSLPVFDLSSLTRMVASTVTHAGLPAWRP